MSTVSPGFKGRGTRRKPSAELPPGQYLVQDFPVLSAGPTPDIDLGDWELTITSKTGDSQRWDWAGFQALASETVTVDLHCVTHWSKLGTTWEGVSLDTLLEGWRPAPALPWPKPMAATAPTCPWRTSPTTRPGSPSATTVPSWSPSTAARPGCWSPSVFVEERQVGGGIRLLDQDEPGFWESLGYHNYGDPWREQRSWGD